MNTSGSVPRLVSVIMPMYNGMEFLPQALASLQSQDYSSLEILAVDDGSTDASLAYVEQCARADRRIIPVSCPHRRIASTLNAGIAMARGEYISFLDQDDLCPVGKIARQAELLSSHPQTVAVFGQTSIRQSSTIGVPNEPQQTMLLSAATFRREVFSGVQQPFDPVFELAHDLDFLLRLLESGLPISVEPVLAAIHRRHEGQATSNLDATRRETALALRASLQRRRELGLTGPLRNPLGRVAFQ